MDLEKYFEGGVLKYTFINVDIRKDAIRILDMICMEEGLIPLNTNWNEINRNDFEEMLHSALQFDLGFTACEIMPVDKVESYYHIFIDGFDIQKTRCFTNWSNNPWKGPSGGNKISIHTLDFALAMMDKDKLLFVYVLFED
ncbi:MAG: hypothetical protein LBL04_09165 [Bacteroidales bacterium]|nr:hypothetical protein [Bacteroidales bacterium]